MCVLQMIQEEIDNLVSFLILALSCSALFFLRPFKGAPNPWAIHLGPLIQRVALLSPQPKCSKYPVYLIVHL